MIKDRKPKSAISEREGKVWEVSRQYARGDISVEVFEAEERKYTPDYEKAMFALGQFRRDHQRASEK